MNTLVGKIDCIQVAFTCSNLLYHLDYVFTCLYNYIDFVLCTAYVVFVLTFPHPGLYWIYGNKDDNGQEHQRLCHTLLSASPWSEYVDST
jgi:hypothetical protein